MRDHPLYHALSQRALNPIKLAYDPRRRKLAPSNQHLKRHYASSPGGLFTNVCRSAAATQIVRPLSSPRYALFTNDVVRRRSWRAYDVVRTTKIMLDIYGRDAIYSADVM